MKQILLIGMLVLFVSSIAQAQSIGIGTDTPDASSILELMTNDKGVLVPRLTATERLAIPTPANALLVYDTDSMCFLYYKLPTTTWINLCNAFTETDPEVGANTTNQISKWDGSALVSGSVTDNGGNIGIGTSTPATSLDVQGLTSSNQNIITVTGNYTGGNTDIRAVNATSIIAPGFGIGVFGTGGYMGIRGAATATTYSGSAYGVYGYASGSAGTRYGVYGFASNPGGSSAYGVYGSSTGATNNWAGYFVGQTYVGGDLGIGDLTPDAKFDVDGTSDAANFGERSGTDWGYVNIQRPSGSSNTVITRYRDNINTVAKINGMADTYQFQVNGDALASGGLWINSDKKIKTNVTNLGDGVVDLLMQLHPKRYNFKTDNQFKFLNLPEEIQVGFIADELQQYFPELVKDAILTDADGLDPVDHHIKSVNYQAMTAILTKAIQEQQEDIEELQNSFVNNDDVKALQETVANQELLINSLIQQKASFDLDLQQCCLAHQNKGAIRSTQGLDDQAHLAQNIPNPFNQRTFIKYFLLKNSSRSQIRVSDLNGALLKVFELNESGYGQVVVEANTISPGTYEYELLIGNKRIDTKKMIIQK